MTRKYDAIIVGGGVIGSSIAYHMAARGLKVALLERERLGGQASSAAAGMLGAQAEISEPGPLFELSRRSRSLFPELAIRLRELSGIDIGLERKGLLRVATTEQEMNSLLHTIEFQRGAGEQADWLSGNEVRRLEPGLSPDILGAMLAEGDGHVLAPELSLAFAKAAAVLGADIREYSEVQSLVLEQGAVSGVRTRDGTLYGERVVMAAGTWSGPLLAQAGLACPIYPVQGECFSVLSHAPLVKATIFGHGCYLVPKKGGRLIVGATMNEHSYDRKVTAGGIGGLLAAAIRLLPGIAAAEWESAWSGLRPQTADGLPFIGGHQDLLHVYVAAGHYRNGILLSPITGQLAADWAEGKAAEGDYLEAFRLDRPLPKTERVNQDEFAH
ncbi:glycine oxidase ThiO [Paenibacillus nasutitermitis]|uniref:glycine oxidase n=1 Tax=Paenibacillus nasutitermitis TaxID=1652958 RepID=A0A916YQR2_9BACL|nr:glycine oxidase ThiO [Paenibacillus nasutitermitis]GGD55479.1 glycine oxidase ThiO [Paenibacillus nasutitermitis]